MLCHQPAGRTVSFPSAPWHCIRGPKLWQECALLQISSGLRMTSLQLLVSWPAQDVVSCHTMCDRNTLLQVSACNFADTLVISTNNPVLKRYCIFRTRSAGWIHCPTAHFSKCQWILMQVRNSLLSNCYLRLFALLVAVVDSVGRPNVYVFQRTRTVVLW